MKIYANLYQEKGWHLGNQVWQISDKPCFIPFYKIKDTVLHYMKRNTNVYALVIEFIDQDKTKEIREFKQREFEDFLKSNDNTKFGYIYDTEE